VIRYTRSPVVFFEDSIFRPPLLPRMLVNHQPVFLDVTMTEELLYADGAEKVHKLVAGWQVLAVFQA